MFDQRPGFETGDAERVGSIVCFLVAAPYRGQGIANIGSEQSRARELVAANRLYRQTAVQAGDDVIGQTLEDLERVLLEIANAPENVTAEDVAALRDQIGARGLLFRVRVVQSEIRERERVNQQNRVAG